MNVPDIEIAIANHFGYRRNVIVPNVSWGFGLLHEADMLIITNAGYAIEVEIKTTVADLRRDKLKRVQHRSNKIKLLYFAIPKCLERYADEIDVRAGILVVEENNLRWQVKLLRAPEVNKGAWKLTDKQRLKLCELGTMRIWSLKQKLREASKKQTVKDRLSLEKIHQIAY